MEGGGVERDRKREKEREREREEERAGARERERERDSWQKETSLDVRAHIIYPSILVIYLCMRYMAH